MKGLLNWKCSETCLELEAGHSKFDRIASRYNCVNIDICKASTRTTTKMYLLLRKVKHFHKKGYKSILLKKTVQKFIANQSTFTS